MQMQSEHTKIHITHTYQQLSGWRTYKNSSIHKSYQILNNEINLTKDVKELYNENCKTLMKETEGITMKKSMVQVL